MKGEGDFVGVRCAPGYDFFELHGIVGDGADLHQLSFDRLRISHSFQDTALVGRSRFDRVRGRHDRASTETLAGLGTVATTSGRDRLGVQSRLGAQPV
jgi:hypothetical protein